VKRVNHWKTVDPDPKGSTVTTLKVCRIQIPIPMVLVPTHPPKMPKILYIILLTPKPKHK